MRDGIRGIRAGGTAALATAALALLPAAAHAFTFLPPEPAGAVNNPIDIATGDFNQDGDADLAVLQETNGPEVSVLLGGPDATFEDPVTYEIGAVTPGGIAVSDFNQDGDLDLAVSTFGFGSQKNVTILPGDNVAGGGAFGSAVTAGTSGRDSWGIATGDFNDEDTDPDLATADRDADLVSILAGASGLSFTVKDPLAVAEPLDVAAGRFNGDEDLDVAVSTTGPDVKVFYGGPGSSFGGVTTHAAGAGQSAIEQADLNGDGDPELVVANTGDDTVSVLDGAPGADFAEADDHAVGDAPSGIAVADFDRDGDPDVAVANFGSDSVSVIPNEGPAGLGAAVPFPAVATPAALVAGDFGGDSGPDLAAPGTSVDEVSLLLSEPDPVPPAEPEPKAVFKTKVVAEGVSGNVYYQCPGGELTLLTEETELSLDCIVYAELGRLMLTSANAAGVEQAAEFYGGDFKMTQVVERAKKKRKGKVRKGPKQTITVLSLYGAKPDCGKAGKSGGAVAHSSARRGLWGSGRGRFRTRGRRSAATVRGTTWFVGETCAGTVTRVTDGVVTVRDFARGKNVKVRAGNSYLASNRKND